MSERFIVDELTSPSQLTKMINYFKEESCYFSPSIEILINGEKVNCPIIVDKVFNTIRINIKTNGCEESWN
jgi:hypothetical protein